METCNGHKFEGAKKGFTEVFGLFFNMALPGTHLKERNLRGEKQCDVERNDKSRYSKVAAFRPISSSFLPLAQKIRGGQSDSDIDMHNNLVKPGQIA
jgi:hypothetical protein